MGARRIRRVMTAGAGMALVALVLVPGVAGASGGGGCGGPVSEGAGATVEIEDFCFGPTILRVAPGDAVTFVNLDGTPHTVLGANATWGGFDALKKGHEATYEFAEAGVFPYVCTWHPGMVGAIVVGDGAGGAIDTTTAAGPVTQQTSGELDAVPASTGVDGGGGLWVGVAGALGLLIGATASIGVRRFRRRSLA